MNHVDKPWGYENWLHVGDYVMKELFVKAGESLSLQYHEKKTETMFVSKGRMKLDLGKAQSPTSYTVDSSRVMESGEHVHIPIMTVHRVTALEDTLIIEASTNDLDDVVRLEDRYGRKGTSAP